MQTPHDSATYWPSDSEFICCARINERAIWMYAYLAVPKIISFLGSDFCAHGFIDDFGNLVRHNP